MEQHVILELNFPSWFIFSWGWHFDWELLSAWQQELTGNYSHQVFLYAIFKVLPWCLLILPVNEKFTIYKTI